MFGFRKIPQKEKEIVKDNDFLMFSLCMYFQIISFLYKPRKISEMNLKKYVKIIC